MDLSDVDLPRYLSVLPPFEGLAPAALQRLAGAGRLQRIARLGMVFRVGEPCPALHVVVTGQVKLFALSPAGDEKVVELIGPGCAFAEAPMFTGHPHLLNALALAETVLLAIAKDQVEAEIGADPGFALRMLTSVSHRLHGLMQGVEAHALHSGVQRVVGFLLRQQQQPAPGGPAAATVSLPVSKATIASLLSLTPEYLSRVLRALESAELIKMERRDIRILDARRLAICQSEPLQALAPRMARAGGPSRPAAAALH